jgi:hypothetical protein
MEYQGGSSQNYYNYPMVQLANASYDPNDYFASSMNSHVGVASCNDTRYVVSADFLIMFLIIHIIIMDIVVKADVNCKFFEF